MGIGKRKTEKKEKDKADVGKREMKEAGTQFPVGRKRKGKKEKRKRKKKEKGSFLASSFLLIFS